MKSLVIACCAILGFATTVYAQPVLRYTFDEPPTIDPLPRRAWEKDHRPNLTGTVHAWRPKGSIAQGGERDRATGDYQPWSPE